MESELQLCKICGSDITFSMTDVNVDREKLLILIDEKFEASDKLAKNMCLKCKEYGELGLLREERNQNECTEEYNLEGKSETKVLPLINLIVKKLKDEKEEENKIEPMNEVNKVEKLNKVDEVTALNKMDKESVVETSEDSGEDMEFIKVTNEEKFCLNENNDNTKKSNEVLTNLKKKTMHKGNKDILKKYCSNSTPNSLRCAMSKDNRSDSVDLKIDAPFTLVSTRKEFGYSVLTIKCGTSKYQFLYTCGTCNKFYVSRSGMRAHMNTHSITERDAYNCSVCDRSYMTRSGLMAHMRKEHTQNVATIPKHICPLCNAQFRAMDTFKEHIMQHCNYSLFRCLQCSIRFQTFDEWSLHKAMHHNQGTSDPSSAILSSENENASIVGSNNMENSAGRYNEAFNSTEYLESNNMENSAGGNNGAFNSTEYMDSNNMENSAGGNNGAFNSTEYMDPNTSCRCCVCIRKSLTFAPTLRPRSPLKSDLQRKFICNICYLRLPNENQLKQHYLTHNKS